MKKAKISELKAGLSRYVSYVRDGGTVYVLDRDVPVAKLIPIDSHKDASSPELNRLVADLERQGILHRGRGKLPPDFARRTLPKSKESVVALLVEDRRDSR